MIEWEVKRLEDKLIELLQTFGYPVHRQGSVTDYPETFFTFWNNDESEHKAYDNQTQTVAYEYDVNVYSTNPFTVFDTLRKARILLKNNDFAPLTRGYDVASDEPTHSGRGMKVVYINKEN